MITYSNDDLPKNTCITVQGINASILQTQSSQRVRYCRQESKFDRDTVVKYRPPSNYEIPRLFVIYCYSSV